MTNPLTGKELVLKAYDYLDKLTRECAKVLLEEFSKTHRKFELGKVPTEVSPEIVRWFERRDKNVRLAFDPTAGSRPQPTQFRLKFKGNTKDVDFVIEAVVGVFVAPGAEISDSTIAFPKTLTIAADRTTFTKRKN